MEQKYRVPLIPTSLPTIREKEDWFWGIQQNFHRLGHPITLYGMGKTRRAALHNLAVEIYEEEIRDHSDPFQPLIDVLWSIAGWVDTKLNRHAGT